MQTKKKGSAKVQIKNKNIKSTEKSHEIKQKKIIKKKQHPNANTNCKHEAKKCANATKKTLEKEINSTRITQKHRN